MDINSATTLKYQVQRSFIDPRDQTVNPISEFIDSATWNGASGKMHWANTINSSELLSTDSEDSGLGYISRVNNIRRINKFLEKANHCLKNGQLLVVNVETSGVRQKRIMNRWIFPLNYLIYLLDFIFNRVVPKISIFQNLYFHLTKGKNRPLSLTEALGRLICCGFHIIDYKEIDGIVYIISKKVKTPVYDMDPTYSLLVKLNRVAKDGKLIRVYKFRTMYPYSEYVQDFLYNRYGTEDGDKIRNDFRITYWGKIFRKLWIDELPMILNLVKGEVKLVGVRPLSRSKFEIYPVNLQQLRIQSKPGLIPPYYADLPQSPEEFFKSEENYMNKYLKYPLRTDLHYFLRSMANILFRGVRSK